MRGSAGPGRRRVVTDPLLAVEDLSVDFTTRAGTVQALTGVSLAIAAAGRLAVVGELGAGKTTLALAVLGLAGGPGVTVSGRIAFEGRELRRAKELRRLRGGEIAMLPTAESDWPPSGFPVGRLLIEAIRRHHGVSARAARDRAIDLLELVGVREPHHRVDDPAGAVAPGERRRAEIALALAGEPRVLVADEPTKGLEPILQAEILDLLDQLCDHFGFAFVLLTDDLAVGLGAVDQVAVLYAGRIVEWATAPRLLTAPEHPYTWALLRTIPRVDTPRGGLLAPLAGGHPSPLERPGGCAFHPRCPFVRPNHAERVPELLPLISDPDHAVACLLDPTVRRQLWEDLPSSSEVG
jgi:peptide/nickel transport system ATP-binding protein